MTNILLIGLAYVVAMIAKARVRIFAGWNFLLLMVVSYLIELFALVLLVLLATLRK